MIRLTWSERARHRHAREEHGADDTSAHQANHGTSPHRRIILETRAKTRMERKVARGAKTQSEKEFIRLCGLCSLCLFAFHLEHATCSRLLVALAVLVAGRGRRRALRLHAEP